MGPKTSPIVNAPPELVAVGHVTWDVSPDDISTREPGGAVAFAAVTADRLGVRAGIVTACANDYPMSEVPIANGMWRVVASEETSTFENRYDERGDRVQVLHRHGSEIRESDVADDWRRPDMLFVGPLTQELDVNCLSWFRPRVSCVVPQGWLRSWTEPLPSVVEVSKSPPVGMSSGWDICVISESEVDLEMLDEWRIMACNLIVTKGSTGAALYVGDSTEPLSIPSFADQVEGVGVDTTGAGDVFAAAMLIRYAATGDAEASARFASLCAALSTRAPSWSAVEAPSLFLHRKGN